MKAAAVPARVRVAGLLIANAVILAAFDVVSRPFLRDGGPGLADLQLSFAPGVFSQIIGLWTAHDAGALARLWWTTLTLDAVFPLAYAALLSRTYVWLSVSAGAEAGPAVRRLPWVAAACDYVENGALLALLAGYPAVPPGLVTVMSLAAAAKFALLTAVAAFSVAALLGGDRGRVLRTARYAVVSLLVGTVPLLALTQGRDLLVSLTDAAAGAYPLSFLGWLTVWAFSVWYWSRVLLEAERGPAPSALYRAWARWTPRVAGALTLILPGVACVLATSRTAADGPLWRLGLTCLLLGALFLWFTIARRQWIRQTGRGFVGGFSPGQLPAGTVRVLLASAAVSLALFAWLVMAPLQSGPALGAVSVLVIAAANTVFIGSVVAFVGRWKRVPIEAIALLCAAVFSLWNDNHDVRLLGRDAPLPARPPLAGAFADWMAPLPPAGGTVPVILVAAEGGGIRAAYWTASVLGELDAQLPERFNRHLLAISAVSGGSIGAAVYAGLQQDAGPGARAGQAQRILAGGLLAPITARLVTGDFLQWFVPWPMTAVDRSVAMEASIEAAYESVTGRATLARGFLDLPQGNGRVPWLLVNATSVDTGRRVVAGPVEWGPPRPSDAGAALDLHALVGDDLRLSTVVHNSARFAYISPAGRLRTRRGEDRGHLVDGGYFENTGADTLVDLVAALHESGAAGRARFVALLLRNTPASERVPHEATAAWTGARRLGEVFAPLRAVLRSREARGELAIRRLRETLGDDNVLEFSVCAAPPGEAEPPLGWELSRQMIDRLDRHLGDCIRPPLERLQAVLDRR